MYNILLMGDGWGAVSALKSLQNTFPALTVASQDEAVQGLMRSSDIIASNTITSYACFDLVICAGYKNIIRAEELKQADFINVHYSKLPQYRGLHSVVWAILNGEDTVALSIHKMTEDIDAGDIIAQYDLALDNMDAAQAMIALNNLVEQNLGQILHDYIHGKIIPSSQDHNKATWVNKRNLEDCKINFASSYEDLGLHFRALVAPYPLPFIEVKGRKHEIVQYKLLHRPYKCTIGAVVNIDQDGAWVKCTDALLVIQMLRDTHGANHHPKSILKIGQRL